MEDINRILAVSWITQSCKGTVHSAVLWLQSIMLNFQLFM